MFERQAISVDDFLARGGQFHPIDQCAGEFCVIHNPSDHHMRDWPRVLRDSALIERTCPHGVGHPDPDSLAYFTRKGSSGFGVHGCDACCRRPDA